MNLLFNQTTKEPEHIFEMNLAILRQELTFKTHMLVPYDNTATGHGMLHIFTQRFQICSCSW